MNFEQLWYNVKVNFCKIKMFFNIHLIRKHKVRSDPYLGVLSR